MYIIKYWLAFCTYIQNPKFYDFKFLATESIFVSFPDWRTKEILDSDICIETEENKYAVHNTLLESTFSKKGSTNVPYKIPIAYLLSLHKNN